MCSSTSPSARLVRALLAFAIIAAGGCRPADCDALSAAQRAAIADTLTRKVADAYDFSKPDVVQRLMSLYPARGGVLSASGGRFTTSRDTLRTQIALFWDNVGRNMRNPRWTWGETRVDVLAPTAAVLTAAYAIPHTTPGGMAHVIGGAWTAVFAKRDGRWVIVQEHLSDAPER